VKGLREIPCAVGAARVEETVVLGVTLVGSGRFVGSVRLVVSGRDFRHEVTL